ncbi:hypothetical protein DL93DRAFT_240806 [Clavulina sp. PMI_390]|nr:hypothetical protein DL93DRAFT_240806 [Clavulina sp. PMI_390]
MFNRPYQCVGRAAHCSDLPFQPKTRIAFEYLLGCVCMAAGGMYASVYINQWAVLSSFLPPTNPSSCALRHTPRAQHPPRRPRCPLNAVRLSLLYFTLDSPVQWRHSTSAPLSPNHARSCRSSCKQLSLSTAIITRDCFQTLTPFHLFLALVAIQDSPGVSTTIHGQSLSRPILLSANTAESVVG